MEKIRFCPLQQNSNALDETHFQHLSKFEKLTSHSGISTYSMCANNKKEIIRGKYFFSKWLFPFESLIRTPYSILFCILFYFPVDTEKNLTLLSIRMTRKSLVPVGCPKRGWTIKNSSGTLIWKCILSKYLHVKYICWIPEVWGV